MATSEAITNGIRVSVVSQYLPDHAASEPRERQWFFTYTVRIANEGLDTVQLISRHWIITDANGLPPDQAANAIGLGLCIGMGCFESGACSIDTLQDPLCLACIGFGLVNQTAPGCEDQAEACKNG